MTYTKIRGVQKPAFSAITSDAEYSTDLARAERIKDLTLPVATRNGIDYDWYSSLLVQLACPKHSAGHESCACPLGFPCIPFLNLGGPVHQRLAELALNQASRFVSFLQVDLALCDVEEALEHAAF